MATGGPPVTASSSRPAKEGKFGERCVSLMQKGGRMIKVRSGSRRYQRTFSVDRDLTTIRYAGSTKVRWLRNIFSKAVDMREVNIIDIQEIRTGAQTDVLKNAVNNRALPVQPKCCFSLVIGSKHKTLDLIAADQGQRDTWVYGIEYITKKFKEASTLEKENLWIKNLFRQADKDGDNTLTFKEVRNLLKHLNIKINEDSSRVLFEDAQIHRDLNSKGEEFLNEEEFFKFVELITVRPEFERIYSRYIFDGNYWTAAELQNFLQKEQFMEISTEECEDLIQRHEPCPDVRNDGFLSKKGFYHLMYSEEMDIFNYKHNNVYQDMTRPMTDYFIDSSHNTYLKADQLVGPSEVEAYIRALKRGCRCVELDCWDGDDGQPVIYHGHTLTSKILFKDTVEAINQHAFTASEYPVILSIENHCSVEQQRIMAEHMKNAFGDKLYTEPLSDDATVLPSPESLKGRIIVKAKKIPANCADGDVSDEDEASEIKDAEVKERMLKEKTEKRLKLATELSDCVVICQSVSFKSFKQSKEKGNFKQMSSFSEYKSTDLVEDDPAEFIKHNQFQISRIYPGALRTDSSNYDPQPMWNVGAQIVALNYQTADDAMFWNIGRFLDNGSCGYVLKPDFLTEGESMFNPKSKSFPASWKKKLSIQIISGWQLPKEKGASKNKILDPYVKLEVTGVSVDKKDFKTKIVNNNGFNPVWEETFEFELQVPQLALLRFLVKDYASSSKNEVIALYCLPVNSLQEGFVTVPLCCLVPCELPRASLLVHVAINEPSQKHWRRRRIKRNNTPSSSKVTPYSTRYTVFTDLEPSNEDT